MDDILVRVVAMYHYLFMFPASILARLRNFDRTAGSSLRSPALNRPRPGLLTARTELAKQSYTRHAYPTFLLVKSWVLLLVCASMGRRATRVQFSPQLEARPDRTSIMHVVWIQTWSNWARLFFNSNYFNERLKCPMFKLITPKLAKTDKGTEPNLEETTAHKMQDCQ
jgi:hypothetical protein